MPPASSPLRPAATRPGATRSTPSAALHGDVNSPEATRSGAAPGASSITRRTEPPSTLKCGRYPNPCEPNLGPFPCENKVYLNGADFQAFRQDDDAPVHLQVTTGAGDWVYLAQALDAVERGVLSLGYAQREETGMREGDEVAVRRWYLSPASSLTTLRLCVAPCGWEEGPLLGRAHIDAADLVRFVRQKVAGQVFKEGQTFVVMYDPYGVGDSCILPCADTRIALDITVQHSCTGVDGKPTQCVEFAGQRPWLKYGQLVEGTAVDVYQRRGTERSLNLRRNNYREFLGRKAPLIVQDVIDVVLAVYVVTSVIVIMMLWFFVSTVSGPLGPSWDLVCTQIAALGPSPDLLDALAARIESPEALISWTELGRAMAFVVVTVVRTAWWAALKFALCNVLAYGGYRVLEYVLPVLRFFSQF